MQAAGADDAQVGYPILHDGYDFHFVDVFASQEEAAVFEPAYELLVGQEGAALEVGRGFGGYLNDDFAELVAMGDAVVFLNGGQEVGVVPEVFGQCAQVVDLGEAEGFLFAGFSVGADEVPDAVAVEQGVGFEAVVAAFFFSGFGVVEFDFLFGSDGLVQGVEIGLAVFDVFILEAFYVHALGKVLLVEAAVDLGQQVLDAAKAGEALDVFGVEVAEFVFVEAVMAGAAFVPGEKIQAFVEVALDGAYADAEFFGQLVDIQAFAKVEFVQDAAETVGKGFVFAAHCVDWW